MKEIAIADRYAEMNQVVTLFVKNKSVAEIARETGLRRVDVQNHLDEWRKTAVGSEFAKDRVEELIASMDKHYSSLISDAYSIVAEVDELRNGKSETMTRSQMLSQKRAALALVADLEKTRIDILQKSGLLEAADVGAELAEMEAQRDLILQILRDELCITCKPKVMSRFAEAVSGQTVVVVE